MIQWFKRLAGKDKPQGPLRGARPVRREKTYSAQSGYVYQYFYEGYRDSRSDSGPGQDHVFSVTTDRANRFPVTVFLGAQAVKVWETAHDRELSATEQYAVVKMRLFQAFDEQDSLTAQAAAIIVSAADLEEHASTLDL
jgi:hypothetical protein